MKLSVWWIAFCAVVHVSASDVEKKDDLNYSMQGTLGFGIALVLTKLDIVTIKLQRLEDRLQKVESDFQQHRSSQEQSREEMFAAIQKLDSDVAIVYNITRQIINSLPQLQPITEIPQKQDCVSPTEESVSTNTTQKPKQPPYSSCKNAPSNVSGTYLIRANSASEPFNVYCEQEQHGGGWIVFQYRYDGSLDFYRGWREFHDGFGDLDKEFWLGLEKLHQITKDRSHELIVELKDFNGTYKYARYDAFEIGNGSDQYDVKDIGKYNGTAGDAMSYTKGCKFSTNDRDNDDSNSHCAQFVEGAWWHGACTLASLNGRYMNVIDHKSMFWRKFNDNWDGLSYSRMMIRELE